DVPLALHGPFLAARLLLRREVPRDRRIVQRKALDRLVTAAAANRDARDDDVRQRVLDQRDERTGVVTPDRDLRRREALPLAAALVQQRRGLVDVLRQVEVLVYRPARSPLRVAHVAGYLHRQPEAVGEDLELLREARDLRGPLETRHVEDDDVGHSCAPDVVK